MDMPPELAAAVLAFQQGKLDEACDLAERHVRTAGATHQSDHLLGLIHCRAGELDEGIAHLRRAMAAEPANLAYRL